MAERLEGSFQFEELENVTINIGQIVDEEEEEWEPEGPTMKPEIADLRDWDYRIFNRYPPFYAPACDMCCLCTFGKCDLTGNKEGACGINLEAQTARIVLIACLMGCTAHAAHGRHILNHFIEEYGADHPIDTGPSNQQTPVISTVFGTKPKTLGDLVPILDYVEEEVSQLLASTHTGQEGSNLDFESKALHAGMLDHVGMEVADIAQISCLDMPKGPDAPIVDVGMGCLEKDKPTIVAYGHNVAGVVYIMDYMDENNLWDEMEIGGICCTAHDMVRREPKAKIVGTISKALKVIRSGVPDVMVVDEQCVRADVLEECAKMNIPVISTNEKILQGLPDRSKDDVDEIIDDLVEGRELGALVLDFEKLGELVPRLAKEIHPKRKGTSAIPSDEEFAELADKCTACGDCVRTCPQGLPIPDALEAATEGDQGQLEALHDKCVGCGKCEEECSREVPVLNLIEKAAQKIIAEEKGKVRAGRGQMLDAEIRDEAINLVMGTTPGVVALVGCSNYPDGTEDLYKMVEELVQRNYIIIMSGCSAMDLGMYKNEDGETLYEQYGDRFNRGNIINLGSCVANSHITGTLIKVPNIFAKRNIRGNWEEIADYTLSRTGAVGVAWGAYSQKAASIAAGVTRIGTPVIVGPHSVKYRRAFMGRPHNKEDWKVYDARDGSEVHIEPAPEHMLVATESWEEAMPMIAKLCIRPSDNNMGRSIKLTNYIEMSQKYLGKMPDDWHLFVRHEGDLPIAKREELLKVLEEEQGWKIDWDRKKIVEGPERKSDVSFQPTNVPRLCKEEPEDVVSPVKRAMDKKLER